MFSGDISQMEAALSALMDKVAALEAQGARDTNAIADKLIAAIVPLVQSGVDKVTSTVDTLTVTVNSSIMEALRLAKRIDGAKIVLGPDVPEIAVPGSVEVIG